MSESLFDLGEPGNATPADAGDARLIAAYVRANRTLDDLPYTLDLDAIIESLRMAGDTRGEREVLHRLQNLRKAGKLPRVGKAATTPPKISDDEQHHLIELVVREVGSLGKRDQLPYTSGFERLLHDFNTRTGRAVEPHTLWRLIAKLAK